ncbi:hypothetical protein EAG_12457 [Camponotus floridanus]|uniref:Uncharacterized protein n=1 Tax=Camponotus floridanus TaxID=104421 RepID=E2ALV7_CAMFO|nr:hypothetical protein EAG_12457 [Camponotus floridanus]
MGGKRSPPTRPAMPAVSSAPATLTTNTVTTVSCGSPVMSPGFPAGRRDTPPRPPHLPTIAEVSPCLVEQRMCREERTPTPPGEEERRQVAQRRSEGDSGEEDEPWRVRLVASNSLGGLVKRGGSRSIGCSVHGNKVKDTLLSSARQLHRTTVEVVRVIGASTLVEECGWRRMFLEVLPSNSKRGVL